MHHNQFTRFRTCIKWYISSINELVFAINESWLNANDDTNKLLLQFGAVDWRTTVFINGNDIMALYGGFDTFSVDLT